MPNILITGGSGMIGQRLASMLLERGNRISIFSRSNRSYDNITAYQWDVDAGTMDEAAFEGVDHIIHLAGAGIADKRWTQDRKKEIYDSRILSTRMLVDFLNNKQHAVKTLISTSAVGIYGNSGDRLMKEDDPPGDVFLANVCVDWEAEAKKLTRPGVRLAIPRIGIVLANEGGALPELNKTTRFGVAAYLGSGAQFYSWIHIDDLCELIIFLMENQQTKGAYNAVAPNPVTNKALVKAIVEVQGGQAVVVPAPAFGLRLALGEMANMILNTQRCDAGKILGAGFQFRYHEAEQALRDLLN